MFNSNLAVEFSRTVTGCALREFALANTGRGDVRFRVKSNADTDHYLAMCDLAGSHVVNCAMGIPLSFEGSKTV